MTQATWFNFSLLLFMTTFDGLSKIRHENFLSMVIFDEKMTFAAKAALALGFIKFINLSLMETLELGMQFLTNLDFKDLN